MTLHCMQCRTGRVKDECDHCSIILALCDKCRDEIGQNFCARCWSDGIAPPVFVGDRPPADEAPVTMTPAQDIELAGDFLCAS